MDIVSKSRLDGANYAVTRELEVLGFYDAPMRAVETYLVSIGMAYGWQWYRTSGHIDIPCVSISRLSHLWSGTYMSLRDVLRHEFGHALADTHRGLFRSRRFSDAFDAAHDSEIAWAYDPDYHVSPYAATNPAEDFAELFKVYVRQRGKLSPNLDTEPLRRKWLYIDAVREAISGGTRRWEPTSLRHSSQPTLAKQPTSMFTPNYEKVTLFAFSGEDGKWRVSKGQPSERLAKAVFRACAEEEVIHGWIAYKEEDGARRIDFSPSFPIPVRTRIQTIIFGMVLG